MPALIVLGAMLVLTSAAGDREISLDGFYTGYRQTALGEGEFVRSVKVPLPRKNCHVRSYKISKRFDQDISGVCGAFWIHLEGDSVAEARIAYGGMAETPRRAAGAEKSLQGKRWDEAAIERAQQALHADFTPVDDLRASASYRRKVAANLLKRFYTDISGEKNTSVWSCNA